MTNPIAQYLFQDNANDSVGSYNGTAYNMTYEPVPADKNFGGKVAVFDRSSSSYINFGNVFNLSGDGAFEFWLLPESRSLSTEIAFCKGGFSATNGGYYFDLNGTNAFMLVNSNSSTYNQITGGSSLEWQHICVAKQGTTIYFYEQGSLVKTMTNQASLSTSTNDFLIGSYFNPYRSGLKGKLANFRVYGSNVPSAAEIAEHYERERERGQVLTVTMPV